MNKDCSGHLECHTAPELCSLRLTKSKRMEKGGREGKGAMGKAMNVWRWGMGWGGGGE